MTDTITSNESFHRSSLFAHGTLKYYRTAGADLKADYRMGDKQLSLRPKAPPRSNWEYPKTTSINQSQLSAVVSGSIPQLRMYMLANWCVSYQLRFLMC